MFAPLREPLGSRSSPHTTRRGFCVLPIRPPVVRGCSRPRDVEPHRRGVRRRDDEHREGRSDRCTQHGAHRAHDPVPSQQANNVCCRQRRRLPERSEHPSGQLDHMNGHSVPMVTLALGRSGNSASCSGEITLDGSELAERVAAATGRLRRVRSTRDPGRFPSRPSHSCLRPQDRRWQPPSLVWCTAGGCQGFEPGCGCSLYFSSWWRRSSVRNPSEPRLFLRPWRPSISAVTSRHPIPVSSPPLSARTLNASSKL